MQVHIGDTVQAVKDLYWSDGQKQHLHASEGDNGLVYDISSSDGIAHIFVRFDPKTVEEAKRPARVRQTDGLDFPREYNTLVCPHMKA
jgi:hypothetical protein